MLLFNHHKRLACLLLAPQVLVTFIFFIWPAWQALTQSFFFADPFGLYKHFAGLTHFIELFKDVTFLHALWVTALIAGGITALTMTGGLGLALLLQSCVRSQGVYYALFLWPYAVAPAVAALCWRFLCQPSVGWVSDALGYFGVSFNYLIHPKQALCIVIFTASWQQLSYNILFFLAALKAIPKAITEAALLDGGSAWQRFRYIIFPLLSPTTFFLLTMNFAYGLFDTFGIIDVLTRGGPKLETTTLIYKVYKDGMVNMNLGSAAAQSVVLMIIVSGLTWWQFRYMSRKVHYR